MFPPLPINQGGLSGGRGGEEGGERGEGAEGKAEVEEDLRAGEERGLLAERIKETTLGVGSGDAERDEGFAKWSPNQSCEEVSLHRLDRSGWARGWRPAGRPDPRPVGGGLELKKDGVRETAPLTQAAGLRGAGCQG